MIDKKIVACFVSRTKSSRLPGKVLMKICHREMIALQFDRIRLSKNINDFFLATTTSKSDDELVDCALNNEIKYFRGSEKSVISRLIEIGDITDSHSVIRILGDNCLTDPYLMDLVIESHIMQDADYSTMEFLPRGTTTQIIKLKALKKLYKNMDPNESQYLTLYINDPEMFNINYIRPPDELIKPFLNFSVDDKKNFNEVKQLIESIGHKKKLIKYINLAEQMQICQIDKNAKIKIGKGKTMIYKQHLDWKRLQLLP